MRNLKRVLSLALAAMMLIGMMVVGASAAGNYDDFTDKDKIVNTEAVQVLNALDVINGKEDGSYFDPTGSVTRAEMAKMITIICLGNVDVSAFSGTATDLKDIASNWAEAYIKYCYSQGIIAGRGNGVFDPTANVTTSEAAKMLLVAIGYNSSVQGYEGSQWAINVTRDAQISGFFEDLSVTSTQALTRDQAAQMIYNAMQAKTVVKTSSVDRVTGAITDSYTPEGPTLLSKTFGVKTLEATFTGNYDTGVAAKDGMIDVGGHDFYSDLSIQYIGEEVKVLWKDETKGTADQPDQYDTIYGVFVTGATNVINTTMGDIKDQKSADAKINVGGTKYDTVANVTVVTNYATSEDKAANNGNAGANSALTTALQGANGNTIKLVCNSDGKVTTAYVVTSTLTHVTAVNSEKVSISGVGSIKIADNDVYTGIAKDDVVVVTTLYKAAATDDGAYTTVKKAETVSGVVNGFKNAVGKNETITLDGTVYNVLGKNDMDTSLGSNVTGLTAVVDADDIGETFTLYLVNGYVAAAAQTSESASNYSLVLDTDGAKGDTFSPLKLEVLAADGTKSIITVDKDSVGNPATGDIITYTGSADNALVKIEAGNGTSTSTANFYNKTSKTVEGTVTAADAVLYVKVNATDYKAYNIRDLGNITTASKACKIIVKDGKVVAAYIDLGTAPSGATATAIYGMVTADNGTIKVGDDVYTSYTLWTTDGEKSVKVKTGGTLTVGTIYKYEPTSDDTYASTAFQAHGGTQAAIKTYDESDKLLTYLTGRSGSAPDATFSTTTTKAVADDLTVLYVNCKDDVAGDDIGINTYDDITDLYNALIIVNSDDVITHIIIETSNEVDVG